MIDLIGLFGCILLSVSGIYHGSWIDFNKGEAKGQSILIQVRQAKLGRTNSGRSYIVKKSTYD